LPSAVVWIGVEHNAPTGGSVAGASTCAGTGEPTGTPPGVSVLEGVAAALGDAADAEADGVWSDDVCEEQPHASARATNAGMNLIGT